MLWLPDERLEQPVILSPGRMPVSGKWMVNPLHKYARNMVICHVPFIRHAPGISWGNAIDAHNSPKLIAEYSGAVGSGLADILDIPVTAKHLIGRPATFQQDQISEVLAYRSQGNTDSYKPFSDGANFTIMGIGVLRKDYYSYSNTDSRFFSKDFGSSPSEHTFMIGINGPSEEAWGYSMRTRLRNTDGSTATIRTGIWDWDKPMMMCGGYDGDRLYVDGVVDGLLQPKVQHTTDATFADDLTSTKVGIAVNAGDIDPVDGYSYLWGGEVWAIYGWNNRYINRSEMLDIYRNPYQMFVPVP